MTLPLTIKVDELFSEWNNSDSPGFALAIIKDGETVYKRGYGIANLEYNIPLSPSSVFEIASTSKQFTAMCIALLARQGKISLDDEIQTYISEIPRYDYPITVRHLIHHTSGIRDYLILMGLAGMRFENEYPDDEIIGLIARQKELNFKPGDEFSYSNSGYFLLGEIVKRASGKSLATFAHENIFSPLGMNATHFHDDFTMIVKDRAIGYSPKDEGGFRIDTSIFDVVGDGAVYTTVEDLSLWDRNFYHNRLGGYGQDLIEEVIKPGTLNSGEVLEYAFGLGTGQYRGLEIVRHGGAWAGYRSEMLRFPQQRFSVICLSNLGSANPTKLAEKVADLYLASEFNEQVTEPARSKAQFVEIPSTELESKIGCYQNPKTGSIWELSVKDGKLTLEAFGDNFTLAPLSSNHFIAVDIPFDIDIEFEKLGLSEPFHLSVRTDIDDGKPDIYQRLNIVSLNSDQLNEFAGEYYSEEFDMTYKIILEDGTLLLNRRNSPIETLKPTSKDLLKGKHTTFQFIRDDHNQVTAFNLGVGRVKNVRFAK
jgi:CubicO group peptidase (beta-lactamase class C family)